MNSLKKAISYSLKPHELGYCGPCDEDVSRKKLMDYMLGADVSEQEIRKLLDEFKGAVTYYRLIAEKNNISDYYDGRVIEAYWLGNDLLDKITVEDIVEMARHEFVGPGLLTAEKMEKKIKHFPKTGFAHHTFHIFFIGAVTGRVKLHGDTRDDCRPSWGEITAVMPEENKVRVKTVKLFPEEREVEKEIVWERMFVPDLSVGETVSFHWGRVSEKINTRELENLKKYTMANYREFLKMKKA